jgi:hypothetical protein
VSAAIEARPQPWLTQKKVSVVRKATTAMSMMFKASKRCKAHKMLS